MLHLALNVRALTYKHLTAQQVNSLEWELREVYHHIYPEAGSYQFHQAELMSSFCSQQTLSAKIWQHCKWS